jgi:hypothetical protein
MGGWPLVLAVVVQQAFNLSSYLFPPEPKPPKTDERKAELLATMGPELRELLTAPTILLGIQGTAPHVATGTTGVE